MKQPKSLPGPEGESPQSVQALPSALQGLVLPEICRVEQLSEISGLSPFDIERELRAGSLPGRRVGATWLIHRRAVMSWLRGCEL